ncbi:MAG: TraM recognition domain-containing protein, partial [Pseudomonadota bacterium]
QTVPMLAKLGIKVAVIDDMGVWPELSEYRVALNPFGAVVQAYLRDKRDVIYAMETITHALIEEAKDDAKNKYWRAWPRTLIEFAHGVLLKRDPHSAIPGAVSAILSDPEMVRSFAEIEAEEGEGLLRSQARAIRDMASHEHWPQHIDEAIRALRPFSEGTRLHEAGRGATLTHADLIRDGYVIFLVGPQAHMSRLGCYYASHIQSFCSALYQRAGKLAVIADEFTNTPLKSLVESLTTLRAFGGELHLIAQSRSEIIRKFGEQETRTLEDNCITKLWYGFSSFEEAERVSKAMGEEHAVAEGLSGDHFGLKSQSSLSLIKQRVLSAAELMALPPGTALMHVKGIGFTLIDLYSQNQIAPFCDLLAENPLEGGRLPPDPQIRLVLPGERA